MRKRLKSAVKFFTYGLIAGLLFAPGSGSETRARLLEWANGAVRNVLRGGQL